MTIERAPSLAHVLQRAMEHHLAGVHVAMPAQVKSYDAANNRVDVQPCLGRTIIEEDRELSEQPPPIAGVPLMFPGSGLYRLTFPIAVGDYVLLVIADRSTEEFVANGGVISAPADFARQHDLTDCFAIPGVIVDPVKLASVSTSVMVLGKNGNAHKPAARKDDATLINATTDSDFFTWLSAVTTVVNGVATGSAVLPTSVVGKINAGSADVEVT